MFQESVYGFLVEFHPVFGQHDTLPLHQREDCQQQRVCSQSANTWSLVHCTQQLFTLATRFIGRSAISSERSAFQYSGPCSNERCYVVIGEIDQRTLHEVFDDG